MTPSVPSLPTKSWVRSGPVAWRGEPPVVIGAPVGQHDVEPDDHVLDLAVAGRVLARRPAGQPAADRRQLDRLGPVPQGEPVVRPQLGFELVAERAGQHVDGEAGARRRRRCPAARVRSSTTPPNTGTLAPHTPLRPPAAVTGTPASWQTRSTAADLGRGRPAGTRRRPGRRPGRRGPRSWRAATSPGWPRRAPPVPRRPRSRRPAAAPARRQPVRRPGWRGGASPRPGRRPARSEGRARLAADRRHRWAGSTATLRRRGRRRAPSRAGRRRCARERSTPGTP